MFTSKWKRRQSFWSGGSHSTGKGNGRRCRQGLTTQIDPRIWKKTKKFFSEIRISMNALHQSQSPIVIWIFFWKITLAKNNVMGIILSSPYSVRPNRIYRIPKLRFGIIRLPNRIFWTWDLFFQWLFFSKFIFFKPEKCNKMLKKLSHRSKIKRDTWRNLYFPLLWDSVRYYSVRLEYRSFGIR